MTIKLRRGNLPKIVLLAYTILVFVLLLFVQSNVISVNHIYAADNNCCGASDYRNGVPCQGNEWNEGYAACVNGGCNRCRTADSNPNDGYCGPGENENNSSDCKVGGAGGAGAGDSTGTPTPTSGGSTTTGGLSDINPNYSGYYYKIVTSCPVGFTQQTGPSCNGKIYGGTLSSNGTQVCCADATTICTSKPSDVMQMCQCNDWKSDPACSQFAPKTSTQTPIVDSCVGAPGGARTKCVGDKQSYCNNGTASALVVTDYCQVLSQGKTNLTEGASCDPANALSNGEGGAFMGCSNGQVCVCRSGKLDCFMDTPDGLGLADSCPQTTTPVVQTPVSNVGDTPETPDIPEVPEQPKTYACETLTNTSGAFTVKNGDTILYKLTFRSDYPTAPYTKEAGKLLMSENGTLATSVLLVTADSVTQRIVGSNYYYDYVFTLVVNNTNNGIYYINYLSDGTDSGKVTSPITCAQTLTVTSEDVPEDVPGLEVSKLLLTGDRSYISGEKAVFSVRIKNTGETTFTNVKYQDKFWSQYLSFTGVIKGRKTGTSTWKNLAPVTVVNKSTGQVDIYNLASSSALGALAPGQEYEIEMNFLTTSPVQWTCNQIYITANDLPGYDDACLGIVPPNTDM